MSRLADCLYMSHLLHSLLNKKCKKREAIEQSVSSDIFAYSFVYLKTRAEHEQCLHAPTNFHNSCHYSPVDFVVKPGSLYIAATPLWILSITGNVENEDWSQY